MRAIGAFKPLEMQVQGDWAILCNSLGRYALLRRAIDQKIEAGDHQHTLN